MRKAERLRVLFICGDPGGASAAAPVIKRLIENASVKVKVFAYLEAVVVFSEQEIPYSKLSGFMVDKKIETRIKNFKTNLLVVGTSYNQFELEKKFIAAAVKLEIPTLAILDYWSNYAERFSDKVSDLKYLPSKIAIMDQLALHEMVAEGIPEDRLVVTGQPAFDLLKSKRLAFSLEDKYIFRRKLGVGLKDLLVLFVSQPFSKLFGTDQSNSLYPGYDEKGILTDLLNVLEEISSQKGLAVSLIIQPHLREEELWWEKIQSGHVRMITSDKLSFPVLALSADLVTGITSTKLVEAAILQRRTLSLQICAKKTKRFDMERLGIHKNIFSKEVLLAEIESCMIEPLESKDIPKQVMDGYATDRVTQLIFQILGVDMMKIGFIPALTQMEAC